MALSSSPTLPSSFDPALELHSETNPSTLPTPDTSHSDELEAFNVQQRELVAAKTEEGVVIQHRSWRAAEAFRSDDILNPGAEEKPYLICSAFTHIFPETPSKKRQHEDPALDNRVDSSRTPPRSPLLTSKMPFISSPVTYPPSSSPPVPRKKRKLFEIVNPPEPKKRKLKGGFIDDGEDEDEDDETAFKDVQLAEDPGSEENKENAIVSDEVRSMSVEDQVSRSPSLPPMPIELHQGRLHKEAISVRTCSGKICLISQRKSSALPSYQDMVAQRSTTGPGRAKKSYFGVDIHKLVDEASTLIEIDKAMCEARKSEVLPSIEKASEPVAQKKAHSMWTEKYRARKFTDLIGDERTHRSVLRWLKSWDAVVFPGLAATRQKKKAFGDGNEERAHRKIMLLTGPPGLGKTTLAHVCARQAGYEVLEINASDERSRDVVKGRIKDALGTENVRGVNTGTGLKRIRKAGKPVCVVVDEVDGVVSGTGSGGEGGFMKALIDLVQLDQKNSLKTGDSNTTGARKAGKGDSFRLLRPLILICNDVYHPALRPLRASTVAEIIHVRKPPLEKVIQRVKNVFEREGIPSDSDGVRNLCEATWGLGGRKEGRASSRGSGEGDIRGILVASEWIAHKIRSSSSAVGDIRLTRKWIDQNILFGALAGGAGSRGLGRGGVREIVERVFLDGAGFPNQPNMKTSDPPHVDSQPRTDLGVADLRKRHAITQLREMVDTSGDYDRCITDCFATYPSQTFQDDTFLSKPNTAYDWLSFHDQLSSRVFSGQEWELNPYLGQSVLAFHDLFAAVGKSAWDSEQHVFEKEEDDENTHPFSGPRADFAAYEAEKQNRATITGFRDTFSAPLMRQFRSTNAIVTELLPNLNRMLAPDVKPVVVGGSGDQRSVASVRKESEKLLVKSAVRVMTGLGVTFERARVEMETGGHGGFVYRMEP